MTYEEVLEKVKACGKVTVVETSTIQHAKVIKLSNGGIINCFNSGGEWQKVALSRMFIKNADLLVLDEPLSAIDIKSDSLIHNNIIMDSNDRSLIMITHKLYDLSKFDTIIVLSNGEIVESGNHNFLLSKQGIYSELYSIQSKRINS